MAGTPLRVGLGLAAFGLVATLGVLLSSPSLTAPARDPFALVMAAAMGVGLLVYALVERRQTGAVDSLSRQLGIRTLLLVPVAVALDIALGAAAANGVRLPLHLDAMGTILIAVLCGPLAGALTGFFACLLWATVVPPPFQVSTAASFAVVAVLTGLLAAAFTSWGAFRPRPRRPLRQVLLATLVMAGLVAGVGASGWAMLAGIETGSMATFETTDSALAALQAIAIFVVLGGLLAALARLVLVRDAAVAVVAVAGVLIGLATGAARAAIASGVLGGQTGWGMDVTVTAVRDQGVDAWRALLGVTLFADSLDRMIGCLVAYVTVAAIAVGTRARFPQAEWIVAEDDDFALRVGSSMRATR